MLGSMFSPLQIDLPRTTDATVVDKEKKKPETNLATSTHQFLLPLPLTLPLLQSSPQLHSPVDRLSVAFLMPPTGPILAFLNF